MSRLTRTLVAGLGVATLCLLLPVTVDSQGRTGGMRRPPTHVVAAVPGHVVFIGGYFYDPFYGPYPWWPRAAYPTWYFPQYDVRAHVRIAATPRDAAVYVDGFYAGVVDDFDGMFQALPLPPGNHELTIYLSGYVTAKWRLYLQPGADLTLRHTMLVSPDMPSERPMVAPPVPPPPEGTYSAPRPNPRGQAAPVETTVLSPGFGTLAIHAEPATAEIRIDGQPCLTSSPGYCEAYVSVGSHRIEVTMPGHQPFVTDVQVPAGKTHTVNIILPTT